MTAASPLTTDRGLDPEHAAHRQRLKDEAERMLKAFEAMPRPETFVQVAQAARALMAVARVVERVHAEPPALKAGATSRSRKSGKPDNASFGSEAARPAPDVKNPDTKGSNTRVSHIVDNADSQAPGKAVKAAHDMSTPPELAAMTGKLARRSSGAASAYPYPPSQSQYHPIIKARTSM